MHCPLNPALPLWRKKEKNRDLSKDIFAALSVMFCGVYRSCVLTAITVRFNASWPIIGLHMNLSCMMILMILICEQFCICNGDYDSDKIFIPY